MNDKEKYSLYKHIMIAFLLAPIAGALVGFLIGALSFKCANYTVLFGADMGYPFGLLGGLLWGIACGWIVPLCGFKYSLRIVTIYVFSFSIIPSVYGDPYTAWLFGCLGAVLGFFHLIFMRLRYLENIEINGQKLKGHP